MRRAMIFAALLLLASCKTESHEQKMAKIDAQLAAIADEYELTPESEDRRRAAFIQEHPDLDDWQRADIADGRVRSGMTAEMVTASLGTPDAVHQSSNSPEQWVYGRGGPQPLYVYIESGVVVGWNN